jgi:hypothetical protein
MIPQDVMEVTVAEAEVVSQFEFSDYPWTVGSQSHFLFANFPTSSSNTFGHAFLKNSACDSGVSS